MHLPLLRYALLGVSMHTHPIALQAWGCARIGMMAHHSTTVARCVSVCSWFHLMDLGPSHHLGVLVISSSDHLRILGSWIQVVVLMLTSSTLRVSSVPCGGDCTWSPMRLVVPAWPHAHVRASSTSAHSRRWWYPGCRHLGMSRHLGDTDFGGISGNASRRCIGGCFAVRLCVCMQCIPLALQAWGHTCIRWDSPSPSVRCTGCSGLMTPDPAIL
jgi:hypothetical protein